MARAYVMDFERPLAELEDKLAELRKLDVSANPELADEIEALAAEIEKLRVETYSNLQPWDRVQVSRHPKRPKTERLPRSAVHRRGRDPRRPRLRR